MTQTEIDVLMANIDANENGHVNYTEFINATIDKKKAITSDKLKAAFDYFDTVYNYFF
jgi:Ca2+-binding EF-hand superfamily protein